MSGFSFRRGGPIARRLRKPRGIAVALALVVGAGLIGAASSAVLVPALAAGPGRTGTGLGSGGSDTGGSDAVHRHAERGAAAAHPGHPHDYRGPSREARPGATMRLAVLRQGGAPEAGVSAVLLNVTAVNETAGTGYLTVFRTGNSRPLASTLNYRAGVAVANLALVPVGPDGTVSIFNSAGLANVVVDIEGWVGTGPATASGRTTTMTPTRILDTRTGTGGHYAPLGSGQSLTLAVEGAGGIPAAGVSAVYADIVAVPVGRAAGYLTAYPRDATAPPASSSLNFMAGVPTANLALLPVSATGKITITNHSPGANVIVDVAGWITGGDVAADAGTRAIPVSRILDTRTTLGGHPRPVGAEGAVSVHVLGVGGVPSAGVAAVVVHVTGVAPTAGTDLKVLATGYPHSPGSTVNLAKGNGSTVSNTAVVPVGPAAASPWITKAGA